MPCRLWSFCAQEGEESVGEVKTQYFFHVFARVDRDVWIEDRLRRCVPAGFSISEELIACIHHQ